MNHFIIGLGGTGGKIIRAFRKNIYQEFREKDPHIAGLGLRYLYVDSSPEMMDPEDPTWKILGESVQLGSTSQLGIANADLAARLNDLPAYPGIQHWIGSRSDWLDILSGTTAELLGGQKRRLGRFLFSCKALDFRDRVEKLVRNMENETSQKGVTFHVCCGLAGGTGSGSLIDAICQIRDLFDRTKLYRIRIYAFVPQSAPPNGWAQKNYLANSYAALLELNALKVESFIPHDVTGATDREEDFSPSDKARYDKAKLEDPFTGCYLYTDVIETNEDEAKCIQVNFETALPDLIADFLYQKIVVARMGAIPELDRIENLENRDDKYQFTKDPKVLLRSKSFLTFGIKRLVIPEKEIEEYLVYKFAEQAALQMTYNYFPQENTEGYANASNKDNAEFVTAARLEENLSRWKMSNEHLKLSLGILTEDIGNKEWKTLTNEWKTVGPTFKDLARQKNNTEWLDALSKFYEDRFERKFRKMGVKEFYRLKLKAKRDIILEVRKSIESELFSNWKNGQSSLNDTKLLVAALIDATQERLSKVDGEIQTERHNEQREQAQVSATAHADAKLGPVGRWWYGQRNFDAHALSLESLYTARTQIDAIGFSKMILSELMTELADLKDKIDRMNDIVGDGLKCFSKGADERCKDDLTKNDAGTSIVRFYNPKAVRDVAETFIKQESEQRQMAAEVRKRLIDELGDKQTFSQFNARIGSNKFIDICQTQCKENVKKRHEAFVSSNGNKGSLFKVNIIEKIADRYRPGTSDFRSFINDLVTKSGLLMEFNKTEMARSHPTIPKPSDPSHLFLVIRPNDSERQEFVRALEKEITECSKIETVFADSVDKNNEITFIRMASCFPLRFIRPLEFLQKEYKDRFKPPGDPRRARLELHLEDEEGRPYPLLFVPTPVEIKRDGLPYVLIAKALTLVKLRENTSTGKRYLVFDRKDVNGVLKSISLGETLGDSWQELDEDKAALIKQAVETELLKTRRVDQLDALTDLVRNDVNAILASRGVGDEDQISRELGTAAGKAIAYLNDVKKNLR
jgi:hypothetical protein